MNDETKFEDLYHGARQIISLMTKQILSQTQYIDELEKQLEHVAPGLVKEAREYLGRDPGPGGSPGYSEACGVRD